MNTLRFDNCDEFVDEVLYKIEECDLSYVSIIAKYDEAKEILSKLIAKGMEIGSIDIADECMTGYADEYIISIENESPVYCEKMKVSDEYLEDYADKTYVLENCSSKVLPCVTNAVEVHICEFHNDCCDDCFEGINDDVIVVSRDSFVDRYGVRHCVVVKSYNQDEMREIFGL